MIRKIVPVTNPALRTRSKPIKKIDKKIKTLIGDLKDTLVDQKDPEGVGLSACQIGKNLRIFAMKPKDEIKIIINPEIISISQEKKEKLNKKEGSHPIAIMEGCLSLPHYYGPLSRPKKIKISYLSEGGEKTTEMFKGFAAQIVQHEIDHLNGVLFVDRLLEKKKTLYELINDEWSEVDIV